VDQRKDGNEGNSHSSKREGGRRNLAKGVPGLLGRGKDLTYRYNEGGPRKKRSELVDVGVPERSKGGTPIDVQRRGEESHERGLEQARSSKTLYCADLVTDEKVVFLW